MSLHKQGHLYSTDCVFTHNYAGEITTFESADGELQRLLDKFVDALRKELVDLH